MKLEVMKQNYEQTKLEPEHSQIEADKRVSLLIDEIGNPPTNECSVYQRAGEVGEVQGKGSRTGRGILGTARGSTGRGGTCQRGVLGGRSRTKTLHSKKWSVNLTLRECKWTHSGPFALSQS